MKKLTRRQFIKLSGVAAAATGLLAGCNPGERPVATTASTDMPAPTAALTARSVPANTPESTVEIQRREIIRFYPDVPSRVVQTHHAGVWDGEDLVPEALRQMLNASITELTGLGDAAMAWSLLFGADERVALKVNAFRNSIIWTHVPLVMAVTDALQEAGIPAGNIIIFDYWTSELETAGFPVNKDGPGVRCYGTNEAYTEEWEIAGRTVGLSNILLSCDALINIPVLKSHMISGISFAMKNHYGTAFNPGSLHTNIGQCLAELNALPPIKDRTRMIIGDVLAACISHRGSFPYWEPDWIGDSILMSFDPVAHDAVGLDILSQLRTEAGGDPTALISMATPCMESGAELGLGTNNPENMELVEINLG